MKTLTNDEIGAITKIGLALYGDRWKAQLSKEIGLSNIRILQSWLRRERSMPSGVWKKISALSLARIGEIEAARSYAKEIIYDDLFSDDH